VTSLRIEALPAEPLAAAATFHAQWLSRIEAQIVSRDTHEEGFELTLVFSPADHTHRGWRLAAVQSLARAHAPARVNAVASDDEAAVAAALRYLAAALGITGQYLPLDGTGAQESLC
jgi:hypothetical protein